MKQVLILLIAFTHFILPACKTRAVSSPAPAADNSRTSLDWQGSYRGVVPCADCPGIAVTLLLDPDNVYVLQSIYLGRSGAPVRKTGTFKWDSNGGAITLLGLDANTPAQYKVGENKLFQLDQQGNTITSPLASQYVLSKVNNELTEKYWKLIELNGQPLEWAAETRREPHMILHNHGRHVSGSGGCNTFRGGFELNANNRVRFTQMASTRMACPQMQTETGMMQALGTADSYHINQGGDTLQLYRGRMAPLARFVSVYLR